MSALRAFCDHVVRTALAADTSTDSASATASSDDQAQSSDTDASIGQKIAKAGAALGQAVDSEVDALRKASAAAGDAAIADAKAGALIGAVGLAHVAAGIAEATGLGGLLDKATGGEGTNEGVGQDLDRFDAARNQAIKDAFDADVKAAKAIGHAVPGLGSSASAAQDAGASAEGGGGQASTTAGTDDQQAQPSQTQATTGDSPATSAPARPAARGQKNVAGIQRALQTLGFDPGQIDGVMGPDTRAAIKQFQEANGLTADGIPGPKTQAALAKALQAG